MYKQWTDYEKDALKYLKGGLGKGTFRNDFYSEPVRVSFGLTVVFF